MITNLWDYPCIVSTNLSSQEATPPTADGTAEEDKPRKRVNVDATVTNLVDLGAIPNQEQETLEGYMTTLEEILARYEKYLQEWPFLVAQRLLKMQVTRLKNIKTALQEKLNNHPLSSANSATFGSAYIEPAPAAADISSQSGGTIGNNSQSANRSGYSNPSTATPVARASSALTLLTRVSIVLATVAFASPLALSRFIHLLFLQGS